jgi:hypothetical protein
VGKFANSAAEMGEPTIAMGPIAHNQPWHGHSDFAALGHEVPAFRKKAGDEHLKAMGFTDAEQRYTLVSGMAERIARDDPHMALENALKAGLDVTGCYRLMAVLMCEPEPKA